jgi:flagellar biosynthesis/type III secretory pathway M-ring protein FliF/YscJ
MREKYLPAIVMLTGGAVISILDIVNKVEFVVGLKRLLAVLIIFYLIGLVARKVLHKAVNDDKSSDDKLSEDNSSAEKTSEEKEKSGKEETKEEEEKSGKKEAKEDEKK